MVEEVLQRVQFQEVVPPSKVRPGVPPELEAVCLACLEKDPARRYPTAAEVAAELTDWLAGRPTRRRPRTVAQKLGRWARRHRAKLAAVAALLVAAVAVAAALPTDPEKDVRRRLARGEAVTLLGETGKPGWYDWHLGQTEIGRSIAEDGTPGLQTFTTTVLVLGRDPMNDRFELTAELRHIKSFNDRDGCVGLFVGMHPVETGRADVTATHWLGVEYSDYWLAFERKNDLAADNHALDALDYLTVRTPVPGGFSFATPNVDRARSEFTPRNKSPNPWRRVRLAVAPDGVAVSWQKLREPGDADDGPWAPAFRVTAAEVASSVRGHNDQAADHAALAGVRYPATPWTPRGAYGLYARNSAVAFKNITVRPIR
jgi:serine/threonine-protein kinase